MKKTVKKLIADVLIITTLISIFALAGCGVKNSDNANADVQDGVTFTDALGRSKIGRQNGFASRKFF